MTFQSHRQGKNKKDEEQLYRESLSISDEDLREVEDSSDGRELETRPEFKSRDDEKQPSVTSGKLVSATEEIIHWEQTQTQETVRPVMLKRTSGESSSHDSEDLSVGKARDLAQDIVGKVIEEAKVRSRETSPAHYPSSSKTEVPSETITLAREIVDNVIDEVKRKLSGTAEEGGDCPAQPVVRRRDRPQHQQSSTSGEDVKINLTDCTSPLEGRCRDGHSSDREKESASGSDGVYHSCTSSDYGKSPSSRPTSGEMDINVWPGHGSSEYETCVTSLGSSSTTFVSAVASQDTSYATARSSFGSHTSSSRASTLEPDSDLESSGHLAELSSEGSETIVADDREATPTIPELEEEEEEASDIIRSGLEGPFAGQLVGSGFAEAASTRAADDEPASSASEGTWHSSSVRTMKGHPSPPSNGRVTGSSSAQQQQQSIVSPGSQEGSVDQGSLKSQSSVR